ncbi:MAG: hypothetical protein ACJAZP_000110 [Psychromonas sp.]|jgi:hypothetical protein
MSEVQLRNTYILVCDESGKLGYARNKRNDDDNIITLHAGILVEKEKWPSISIGLEEIYNKYHNQKEGKFHITDVKNQCALRLDVFKFIQSHSISDVYCFIL